jgi:predicted DNA-binding ribbon-helix-helix protein
MPPCDSVSLPSRSRLVTRNVMLAGKRTSIRLEPEMWDALSLICEQQDKSLHAVCSEIALNNPETAFTSAVRVFILRHFVASERQRLQA